MPEIPCGVSGIVLVFFGPKYLDFPSAFTVHRSKAATGKPRGIASATSVAPVASVASVASAVSATLRRTASSPGVVCGRSQSGRADNKKDRSCKRSFRLNDSRESAVSGSSAASCGLLFDRWRSSAEQGCGSHGTHAIPCPAPHCPDGRFPRCIAARNGEPILSRCRSAWDPPSAHSFRGACCRGTA